MNQPDDSDDVGGADAPWSPDEREALAAWTAPAPPPDFTARVIATATSRASNRGVSALPILAAAAAVFVIMFGLVSLREAAPPADRQPAMMAPFDAGPSPEVRPPFDGVPGHPS